MEKIGRNDLCPCGSGENIKRDDNKGLSSVTILANLNGTQAMECQGKDGAVKGCQ